MKKSLVLFIALILLAVTVVYYGQTSLMAERDQVQITEHILYGDKSVVEGVTLQMKNHCQNQMFWDTTYVLGETPKISTDYTFCQEAEDSYRYWYYGTVTFEDESTRMYNWDENHLQEEMEGIEVAVQELCDSIGPSERGETLVYIKDYVDYYPFSVFVSGDFDTEKNVENFYIDMSEPELESELFYAEKQSGKNYSYSKEAVEKLKKKLEWLKIFQEFFKIPVLDTEVCAIAVEKDSQGNVLGYGYTAINGGGSSNNVESPELPNDEDYDAFCFETRSTLSNGNAYFTFNTHSYNDVVVDTSLIPGGYGIYHFPYDESKNEIYPEKLQMVYPLDPNIIIQDLTIDQRGEHLLLFTEEDDGIYMSVIDIATMKLEDKIVVSQLGEDDTFYGIDYYSLFEDYMVVNTFGELVVFTIDEEGNYKREFEVSRKVLESHNMDETGNTQIAGADTVYDWDGEKLVFANHIYNVNGYMGCNFYVGVVDEKGLQYFASYDTSLCSTPSKDENGYYNYNYPYCRPVDDRAMSISW